MRINAPITSGGYAMSTRFLLASLSLFAFACSGQPAAPDDTTTPRFVGRWTYQSGSAVVVDCPNAAQQTIDLFRVPPDNQPAYFTFTATAPGRLHEVDARGCQYDWAVAGDVATAASGQSCATFPDGRGGNRVVHLASGTKTTTDGASMRVDVHFTSDDGCAIHTQGQTTKS
jgi:hypothetical protein